MAGFAKLMANGAVEGAGETVRCLYRESQGDSVFAMGGSRAELSCRVIRIMPIASTTSSVAS